MSGKLSKSASGAGAPCGSKFLFVQVYSKVRHCWNFSWEYFSWRLSLFSGLGARAAVLYRTDSPDCLGKYIDKSTTWTLEGEYSKKNLNFWNLKLSDWFFQSFLTFDFVDFSFICEGSKTALVFLLNQKRILVDDFQVLEASSFRKVHHFLRIRSDQLVLGLTVAHVQQRHSQATCICCLEHFDHGAFILGTN